MSFPTVVSQADLKCLQPEDIVMAKNKKFFQIFRMWPENIGEIKKIRWIAIPYIFLIIVWLLIPAIYFLLVNYDQMIAAGYCMVEILVSFLYLMKFIHYVVNQMILKKFMRDLQLRWIEAARIGHKEWDILKKDLFNRNNKLINLFVGMTLGMTAVYFLNEFFVAFVHLIFGWPIQKMPVLLRVKYFFNQETTMLVYIFFNLFTFLILFTIAYGKAVLDIFGISLINYVTTYCKYVNVTLKKIDQKYDKVPGNGWTEEIVRSSIKDLSDCVHVHVLAIDLVQRLEQLLSPLMILRFLGNTFVICFGGLSLYIVMEEKELIFLLLTCSTSIILELFIYSYFGDKLMEEILEISTTVYCLNWYNKPIVFQKMILLIMMRAQKPAGLTAAKFYFININTFSKVMKASMSYIAIFQTIYMK